MEIEAHLAVKIIFNLFCHTSITPNYMKDGTVYQPAGH